MQITDMSTEYEMVLLADMFLQPKHCFTLDFTESSVTVCRTLKYYNVTYTLKYYWED